MGEPNSKRGVKGLGEKRRASEPLLGQSSPPAKQKVSFCFSEGQES